MSEALAAKRYGDNDDTPFYAKASPTLLAGASANPVEQLTTTQQRQEWEALYQHYESRFQALWNWRLPFWSTWGQIGNYMKPYRYYPWIVGNTYDQGVRKDYAIVDRTATLAGEVCAAGLQSTLTDPDRDWLSLGPAIPNFELDREGKQYYEDLAERLNYVYDHSNFYEGQAQVYDDLTFFGNGVCIDYESATDVLHVVTPCAGEALVGVNFDNGDEVLYREFRQTVSQTVEMFGIDNVPSDVQKMWRQKGGALEYQNVIRHAIEPNFEILGPNQRPIGQVPGGFAWRENYWIGGKKDCAPLSTTGFHEQPQAVARWNVQSNEAYGRGVGENMLGDCIQLQFETRQKAESLEKVNRPPMGADVSLMNQPAATSPGQITYFNTGGNGEKKFFPLFEVKPDIPAIAADIQLIQERISRTAYNDVFQILMNLRQNMGLKADMTATEIEQLTQEVLTRLGPMMGRVYGTLRQRVRRHLRIMARRGLLPPKPPSLQGVPTRIEFVSMLTEARRAVKTQSVARTAQFIGSLTGVWPEARNIMDPDKAVRDFADGVGAPANLLRTKQEVQSLIAQQAKDQAMQQAIAQSKEGSEAAKALSSTSLAPGNALSALVAPPSG